MNKAYLLPLTIAAIISSSDAAPIIIDGSDHRLMLDPRGQVCALEIPADEFARWDNFAETSADASRSTKRIFEHFNDDFDIILFVDNVNEGGGGGRHRSVRNSIQGLDRSNFDSSAYYGATGTLQSIIHLTNPNTLRGGPSLHEIAHRWGNSILSINGGSSHWGYSSVGGQLGGWKPGTLADLGGGRYDADGLSGTSFGTFANGGNSLPYSQLELYLMGLIPANEVDDIKTASGAAWEDSSNGIFTATAINTVTVNDIIAVHGARVPDHTTSQKNFRALVVLLTTAPVDEATWNQMDTDITAFALAGDNGSSIYNFWEATGGRATIQMDDIFNTMLAGKEGLTVTPTHASFDATRIGNGAFDLTSVNYTLRNEFSNIINWSCSAPNWIDLSTNSGALAPGAEIVITASLNANATAQGFGRETGEIRFTNTDNHAYSAFAASLASSEIAYYEDFETGALTSDWAVTGTNTFRVRVGNYFFPQGSYHAILDDSVSDSTYSRTELTLTVDLARWNDLILSFDAKEFGDESHGPAPRPFTGGADFDGVAVRSSNSSDNWYEVQSLQNLSSDYTTITVDLEAALAGLDVPYSDTFQIRFNQYDNFATSSDGIAIDNIQISGTPPQPELNSMIFNSGTIEIEMLTRTGKQIRLQKTTDLSTTPIVWQTADGPLEATSPTHTFTIPKPADDQCFFRCTEE